MRELIIYANLVVAKHPELRSEIKELVELCRDEIESGELSEHEIELCIVDIKQLIKEDDNV